MQKFFILVLLLLSVAVTKSQQPVKITLKNLTLAATDSVMPFWLTANREGKIPATGSFYNISDFSVGQAYPAESTSAFSFTWGGNLVASLGEINHYHLNKAFAGLSFRGWELKSGLFHVPVKHGGLSTTNGNLARSRNARPYPMIRFSTRDYKPVPLLQNFLMFRAEYDEGLLNDNRYTDGVYLHHKSLYLKASPAPTWQIKAGFEHFVMWGGTSPSEHIGEMPDNFSAYLRYVFGRSGGEEFPETDQRNVAGNQLGTYQLEVTKTFPQSEITFYLSHPFEDLSGVNWRNWPDNLLGLYFSFTDKDQPVSELVYEFTDTRQQSIRSERDNQEPDGYFNHGVYRSGFTYHQRVMSSPLFYPVNVNNGVTGKIQSNRFYAHHLGVKGHLPEYISWKGFLTYIHHFGLYFTPYEPSQKQMSGLLEIWYKNPGFIFDFGLLVAADAGSNLYRNAGMNFIISKSL